MGTQNLFNLLLPSNWKVFIGPHDSYTLRLMAKDFTNSLKIIAIRSSSETFLFSRKI